MDAERMDLFSRWLEGAMLLGQSMLTADFLLEFYQGVEEHLWTGRAARDVNINGEELVYALDNAVDAVHATCGGTGSHSDTPFWFGHLVPDALNSMGHFIGAPAGDNHDICLPRGEREAFGAEAGDVIFRAGSGHHFDSAAG